MRLKTIAAGNSNWLKGAMLDGEDVVLTVKDVTVSADKDGKDQVVLTFEEIDKKLGLNLTNLRQMIDMVGSDDSDEFIGKAFTFFPIPSRTSDGKPTTSIAVKPKFPAANAVKGVKGLAAGAGGGGGEVTDEDVPF